MTQQPEALRLADEWWRKTQNEAGRRNSACDHYGMDNTPENVDPLGAKMATELRRLHAQRGALLEALKEMRIKYGEYACSVCDQADAAIKAVEGEKK